MEQSSIYTGTNTLTDNWLLQSVAEFLSGSVDRSEYWRWLWSDIEGVYHGQIKAGAFQIDCLTTILEQVLFANNIYVMKEWIPSWHAHDTDLNLLHSFGDTSIIKELSVQDQNIVETKSRWLNDILFSQQLREKFEEGMEKFSSGEQDFWSQVVNGVAEYVSLSSANKLCYAPHSARAGFLKSTLWFTKPDEAYPSRGVNKFNLMIDKERIQLSETLGYDATLTNLNTRIPSGALLCIQQSSEQISPIKIALQMRDHPEIRAVRTMLHELSEELIKKGLGENSKHTELINQLEDDIRKASNLLRIPKSMGGDDKCVNQIVRQFNYEKNFGSKIIHKGNTINHSGILMDLLDTGSLQTRRILESKFNIKDHQIIRHFIEWNSSDFFKKFKLPQKRIEYKVHIELNGDNNVIVGPDGNILNSTINQEIMKSTNSNSNPWLSGSFYLVLAAITLTGLGILSNTVHWSLLPIIIIGGILIIGLIGVLQLRNDDKLKDESFVTLVTETFKRLPLLKPKQKNENTDANK